MAASSFTFRERLKRFRCFLKATFQQNRFIGFSGRYEERDPFPKNAEYSDSEETLRAASGAGAAGEPSVSMDVKVPAIVREPYLTWLTYSLGITSQAQNLPNVESRQAANTVDENSLKLLEPEVTWPFDEFPIADSSSCKTPRTPPPQPTFYPFMRLPFEIRMKIYQMTITPRLVHYNGIGAYSSRLQIRQPVPLLMRISQESRTEGRRLYHNRDPNEYAKESNADFLTCSATKRTPIPRISEFEYTGTWPVNFSGAFDTLLWTRYRTVRGSFQRDAARLLLPDALRPVGRFAILIDFWNKIVSDPARYRDVYAAIRDAPNLRTLCLVDEEGPLPRSARTYGKVMGLRAWDGPGCERKRLVRWEKDVRAYGKEKVWEGWDGKVLGTEEVRRVVCRRSPDIRFASVVVEKPNKKRVRVARQLEEW